ncbi:MAG: UvrABC system protein B [Candidatus Shapirobacteria bacterium GW2011_GWE1_38_92]|uniref:UvrABC system protein B n=1 Tax=Candidatus Shapirobacteria bacterium GW2011_GWE1_38_92 TaxID=1618489 RepID=A0A0G0PN27_9BACT|nr:MAG: UvrABC system protein B [Candidatus Shapirobacteria bacterium GW2011_GWE1_38_92]
MACLNEILKNIIFRHPYTGNEITEKLFTLYPAKQYVSGGGPEKKEIYRSILSDAQKQVKMFKSQNRLLEANRIQQRVEYDLEMLQETGYINGIENYSIYFEQNRKTGDPPYTLVDYFKRISRYHSTN